MRSAELIKPGLQPSTTAQVAAPITADGCPYLVDTPCIALMVPGPRDGTSDATTGAQTVAARGTQRYTGGEKLKRTVIIS